MISWVLPISVPLWNVLRYVIVTTVLVPILEVSIAKVYRMRAFTIVLSGGVVRWDEPRAGPWVLHGKHYGRLSKYLLYFIGFVFVVIELLAEFGVDSQQAMGTRVERISTLKCNSDLAPVPEVGVGMKDECGYFDEVTAAEEQAETVFKSEWTRESWVETKRALCYSLGAWWTATFANNDSMLFDACLNGRQDSKFNFSYVVREGATSYVENQGSNLRIYANYKFRYPLTGSKELLRRTGDWRHATSAFAERGMYASGEQIKLSSGLVALYVDKLDLFYVKGSENMMCGGRYDGQNYILCSSLRNSSSTEFYVAAYVNQTESPSSTGSSDAIMLGRLLEIQGLSLSPLEFSQVLAQSTLADLVGRARLFDGVVINEVTNLIKTVLLVVSTRPESAKDDLMTFSLQVRPTVNLLWIVGTCVICLGSMTNFALSGALWRLLLRKSPVAVRTQLEAGFTFDDSQSYLIDLMNSENNKDGLCLNPNQTEMGLVNVNTTEGTNHLTVGFSGSEVVNGFVLGLPKKQVEPLTVGEIMSPCPKL